MKTLFFLINPNSVEDIVNKMKLAYDKRKYIPQMGNRLYDVCAEKFSVGNFCRQYNHIYQEIIYHK